MGDKEAPCVVFANSLGTDFRLWDPILPFLPNGLRIVRYDKRGHGLSQCPAPPYSMGALVHDAERLLDHLNVTCEYKNVGSYNENTPSRSAGLEGANGDIIIW